MQDDLFGQTPAPPSADCADEPMVQSPAPKRARKSASASAAVQAAPQGQQWAALAKELPAALRMGVSTWSYPGWDGLVWDGAYDASQLAKHGLHAYAQHPLLRTVCIDRSFWRPLTASQYLAYAGQVPEDFRFVVKCPSVVTDAQVRGENGQGQAPNSGFLQADLAVSSFVQPALEGLGQRLGVLVFQLSPLPWEKLSRPSALLVQLGLMLAAVRQELLRQRDAGAVIVAVEVRDPELLTPALAACLRAHGATYCLGLHAKMPPIAQQLPLLRALWPGPLVCRWNLHRSFGAYGYPEAQKTHTPFDEIRSPDPDTRQALAKAIAGITGAGQPAFVTISNDAEGCAPRSIALLAQAVHAQAA